MKKGKQYFPLFVAMKKGRDFVDEKEEFAFGKF